MTVAISSEPRYLATVYHDEPEDANTDSKSLGWFPSLDAAVRAVQAARDDYWNALSGSVHYGYVITGDGPLPYWEDDDDEVPWLVTADTVEQG